MGRLTFDKIRQARRPHGWEVLAFIESLGFRLAVTPGMRRPVLCCSPDTPILLCLEVEELFLDHAEVVFLALAARRKLYARVGWRQP